MRSISRPLLIVILIIIVAGAYLRSHDLLQSWVGHHNAWGGAMYGNIARNFVKYGYWTTEFGPVANSGTVSSDKFEYYYHYPSLLVWLISASFHAFGVHEWSARLVPLLFSVSLMALVFVFARRLFTENIALLALLFTAIMPIEGYYGAHVDIYGSVAVFFSLLAVYGYARWLESRRKMDFALCVVAVVLGCMTTWYTYFLVPLIIGHCYFLAPNAGRPRDHRILILAGSAVAVFALFLLHRQILISGERGEVAGTLLQKLLLRSSLSAFTGDSLGVVRLALKHLRDMAQMYSPPLLLLALMWLFFFFKDALRKRLQTRDWLVLMLFGYGFLHNAAFPSLLVGHDFLVVCYVPGIAVAASVAMVRFGQNVSRVWGVKARNASLALVLAITVTSALYMTRQLSAADSDYAITLKRWGETIRNNSRESDLVLACTRGDRVFQYYAEREIKFDVFLNAALKLGADYIATGHYCRKGEFTDEHGKPVYQLLEGKDPNKDQSYFLCQLTQAQLSKALFPIGDLLKPAVRALARKAGLTTADKKDSQGLCFVGKVHLPDFLQQRLVPKKGNVIDIPVDATVFTNGFATDDLPHMTEPYSLSPELGEVVGEHNGAHYYTIGQRRGLNIGGFEKPLFVIGTDTDKNVIYTGMGEDHPGLYRKGLFISKTDEHWIRTDMKLKEGESKKSSARIRYRQPLEGCVLHKMKEGLYILFDRPQRGVTPGQFAAWYDGSELIGSGVIN